MLLREACRRSDVIIRWGGDEFLVVGRQTDRRGGDVLAERIRSGPWPATRSRSRALAPQRLTCSIGYASAPVRRAAIPSG